MVSIDYLETALRRVLNHLYDPTFLRDSPLISLLHLGRDNAPTALHSVVERAIEELGQDRHPATAEASRRHYEVLFHRYLQQFTQEEVAHQLGVSARHLRRQQTQAVRALAEHLRKQYGLKITEVTPADAEDALRPRWDSDEPIGKENVWLEDSRPDGVADVDRVLRGALSTARLLAEMHRVQVGVGANAALPLAAIDATVLKQIVLNLLTALMGAIPGGTVSMTARTQRDRVIVYLYGIPDSTARKSLTWDEAKVAASTEMARVFLGDVGVSQDDRLLTFYIDLPSTECVRVLAIEDNEDTLHLWSRYVEHTRFSLVIANDPHRALETAIEQRPDLIVLDVMMPGLDGWDILAQMQRHPALKRTPMIICTVLPQRDLALSLGASDFISKPTTRQSFLEALRRQTEALGR